MEGGGNGGGGGGGSPSDGRRKRSATKIARWREEAPPAIEGVPEVDMAEEEAPAINVEEAAAAREEAMKRGEMRARVSWIVVLAMFLAFPGFQRERIEEMGFGEILRTEWMRADAPLTQALRGRWDTEATTFVFPWGHMIPNLEDVSKITGLRVHGRSVSGFTYPFYRGLAHRLLDLTVGQRSSLLSRVDLQKILGLLETGRRVAESVDEQLQRLRRGCEEVDVTREIASVRALLHSAVQDREVAQREVEELFGSAFIGFGVVLMTNMGSLGLGCGFRTLCGALWAGSALLSLVVRRLFRNASSVGSPRFCVSQARECTRGLSGCSGTVEVLSSFWTPSLSGRVVIRLRERRQWYNDLLWWFGWSPQFFGFTCVVEPQLDLTSMTARLRVSGDSLIVVCLVVVCPRGGTVVFVFRGGRVLNASVVGVAFWLPPLGSTSACAPRLMHGVELADVRIVKATP
ncbi:hypothetical protein Taro_044716 [Colocasia esculenta]|uniref:Aminotransferase-like plant mobile domain-containing protein n=1 Tax=Colocasia esculenta TaxID=4460 RepID=A0A843X366_COLES|nr:hypothetical protein [Colocasia esculenta]